MIFNCLYEKVCIVFELMCTKKSSILPHLILDGVNFYMFDHLYKCDVISHVLGEGVK